MTGVRRVSVRAGNYQSTRAGMPFSAQLTALVADDGGRPVAGARVTFRVASGSAAFVHGARSATSTTGPLGVATSQVLAAGAATGAVQIMATTAGAPGPATFTLRVVPAPPGRAPSVRRPALPTARPAARR